MSSRLYAMSFLLLSLTAISQLGAIDVTSKLTYVIVVQTDGSAKWSVEIKGMDVSALFDSFSTFFENASRIVDVAAKTTRRNMSIDGLSMSANVSGSYEIVTYRFIWRAFAEVHSGQITLGDIFNVEGFFSYFFGDGEVFIVYPVDYLVENVSPLPSNRIVETRTLQWYGVNDFGLGEPHVVLSTEIASDPLGIFSADAVLLSSVAFLGVLFVGLYLGLRRREMKRRLRPQTLALPKSFGVADDEERVANMLRASGGSMYQSVIADQCDFSRSKASKLLAAMEVKGKIRREDKGREKVVTLIEGMGESNNAKRSNSK